MVISESKNGEATSYTYGLERISAITGNTRTEYVYDGRGSVAAEVSYNTAWYTFGGGLARKNVVSKSYSPFGELLTEQTSGFGYNGEYYNAATGMIYLRARFYEPEMHRFGQKDILRGSITDGISLNRYLYCQSDPVNFADYNGLQMVNVCVADGGGSGRDNSMYARTTANTNNPSISARDNSASAQSARDEIAALRRINNGNSSVTTASPSVQDITGSGRYSCGREINALGAGGPLVTWENYLRQVSERFISNSQVESEYLPALLQDGHISGQGVGELGEMAFGPHIDDLYKIQSIQNLLQHFNQIISIYDFGTVGHAGCEPITAYNVLYDMGNSVSLSQIIYDTELNNNTLWNGWFGTNIYTIDDLLRSYGVESKPVLSWDVQDAAIKGQIEDGQVFYASIINDKRMGIFSGIHSFEIVYSPETNSANPWLVYNRYSNTSRIYEYSDLQSVLENVGDYIFLRQIVD